MRSSVRIICLACLLLSVNALARTPLVLLSIDGFAQRYLELYQPKTLQSLIKKGTSANALVPVYPSKTFPNHLSIITGQYPAHHGIVHNNFFHRTLKQNYYFGAGKHESSWVTALPLWYINQQQGNKSAVYFWPESEAKINGHYPDYYLPYQDETPNETRLTQVLDWLRLPQAQRPNFIASYFSTVDTAGHEYGENSPQLINAIAELDQLLATFINTINSEFSGQVNIVIVSDHGMTAINPEHIIDWREQIDKNIRVVNGSTQLYVYSDDQQLLNDTRSQLLTKANVNGQQRYKVYQYPDFPTHWHFNHVSPALPNLVVDAQPSYLFENQRSRLNAETHGYDPLNNHELNAIFIAVGPAFKKDREIDAFENIHVLPIITRALGLKDVDNIDGKYDIATDVVVHKFTNKREKTLNATP